MTPHTWSCSRNSNFSSLRFRPCAVIHLLIWQPQNILASQVNKKSWIRSCYCIQTSLSSSLSFLDHGYYFNETYAQLPGAFLTLNAGLRSLSSLPKPFRHLPLSLEKIGIVYCCPRRAHCQPISWAQSCPDTELIHAHLNCALRGRKQI